MHKRAKCSASFSCKTYIRGTQILLLFLLSNVSFGTASGIISVSFEWVPQGSANLSQTGMHVKTIHGEHIR